MNEPQTAPAIPGAKVLLMGATGTGKTHSLRTLVDAGLTPFIIFTEPHGINVVQSIPCPKLHYAYLPPVTGSFGEKEEEASKITKLPWSVMAGMTSDPNKPRYTGFLKIYATLHKFECARCKETFDDVGTWGNDRAIVLDSYSGINKMAMQMFTGGSIAKSSPQWGAAMNAELELSNKLCSDTKAHYILIAHIERQTDEVYGGTKLVPLALGRKVAPDLPILFSDVIHVTREMKDFNWSTATANADLKANNVAISDKISPSFVPLIDTWRRKGGL